MIISSSLAVRGEFTPLELILPISRAAYTYPCTRLRNYHYVQVRSKSISFKSNATLVVHSRLHSVEQSMKLTLAIAKYLCGIMV